MLDRYYSSGDYMTDPMHQDLVVELLNHVQISSLSELIVSYVVVNASQAIKTLTKVIHPPRFPSRITNRTRRHFSSSIYKLTNGTPDPVSGLEWGKDKMFAAINCVLNRWGIVKDNLHVIEVHGEKHNDLVILTDQTTCDTTAMRNLIESTKYLFSDIPPEAEVKKRNQKKKKKPANTNQKKKDVKNEERTDTSIYQNGGLRLLPVIAYNGNISEKWIKELHPIVVEGKTTFTQGYLVAIHISHNVESLRIMKPRKPVTEEAKAKTAAKKRKICNPEADAAIVEAYKRHRSS